MAAVETQLRK